jgi:hypothetical protein
MHLIVPFAAPLSDAGRQALRGLRLPGLQGLLQQMAIESRDEGDALSLSPPHERALARAVGLAGADGELPWGAWHAAREGIDTADLAWGLVTPAHWEVSTDHVRLSDPAALALDAAASRAFFEALHPLFESEGVVLVYGAPQRWYVAHESLQDLPTASPDRVIGRALDAWLPTQPQARLMRRLQNEAQMLLYTHALNAARDAQGLLPLNSFWLSGCGLHQPAREQPAQPARFDDRLRSPALAEDWAAWREAWRTLDQRLGRLGPELQSLALCGERSAVQLVRQPRGLWQRLRGSLGGGADVHALLETL